MAKLELLPAVDVRDGQAVRLVHGESGSETSYGSPLEAALAWQRSGANWLHLVDLDAAFGRGSKGYVVINHEGATASRSFQTSLPAGTYCNVQNNTTVTVNSTGWFTASVAPNTALAIYAGKSSC